jgi:DNA (cytosine-5)-methyltransferase 1
MKILSLFSGGGLGDYGLELAGMEIIGQVEIDDYCQKILKLRWPDVPKWRDIKSVTGTEVIERCGQPDIISGGFPCQDISVAGRGVGITGARSGLWKEMFRIICEIRPRFVLVENVAALLSRGMGTVLGDLASIGYDCEWDCIPASAVGAPHQRDRVWIVANYVSRGCESKGELRGMDKIPDRGSNITMPTEESNLVEICPECGKGIWYTGEFWKCKCGWYGDFQPTIEDVADTESERRRETRKHCERSEERTAGGGKICNANEQRFSDRPTKTIFKSKTNEGIERSDWWAVEPDVGRVANGVANRVDRLKLLGNGQVVQVVEWIGKRIMELK